MKSAVARAERRLGFRVPKRFIREAKALTGQKILMKKLPESYRNLLLEDEIVDACMRAYINGRCA